MIRELLQAQGITVTGEPEIISPQPWSTVMTIPTTDGRMYFKRVASSLWHEVPLTLALHQWRPDCMPQVVASGQDWLLLADAGDTLRSIYKPARNIAPWHEVLRLYAEVQQQMTQQTETLLSFGVFDRRLDQLPALFENLLHTVSDAPITAQLKPHVPEYAALCGQLNAYGLPMTLHHDDFHGRNIFVKNGRYTFADWGESCVTHPFFTLLVTLRSIAYHLELEADAPEIIALRDGYLNHWAAYGTIDDLREACNLALRLATVNRALTWHHILANADEQSRAENDDAVTGWLGEFLA